MARLSESLAGSRNMLAFVDMLAWSEGTSTSPATAIDGYDVIVTGIDRKPEVFKDFTDYPFAKGRASKTIKSKGLTSNASGRYQQMLKDWPHYKALLKLPDFSPISHDLLAIQHIREYLAARCDCRADRNSNREVPEHLGQPAGGRLWSARASPGGSAKAVPSGGLCVVLSSPDPE